MIGAANLAGANLAGASLEDADLSGARATRTAWWADLPGRNPNDDPEKCGSKIGVSTCAMACL